MKYSLSNSQFALLLDLLNPSESDSIRNRAVTTSCIEFSLVPTEVELVVDRLSDALISQGLSPSYEPTELGLKIEELIDVFSPYREIKD